jgi:phosphatidate cytidylyltransferase
VNDRAPFPPSFGPAAPVASSGNLSKRVASSVVLAALAIIATAVGGWPFVVLWGAAAIVVYWEWSSMVARQGKVTLLAGGMALVFAAAESGLGHAAYAAAAVAAGAIIVAVLARRRLWCAGGVIYAGVLAVAPMMIRLDRPYGSVAVFFLFAVVWATDIFGYFIGRLVGGPKLAVRISPKKTWAGAFGGAAGAMVAGVGFMSAVGYAGLGFPASTALMLSIVSQCGDLLESAVKRRFGVKDASHVIPGHGGLMDRLDGFLAAVCVAAVIGVVRNGPDAAAHGLLLWRAMVSR